MFSKIRKMFYLFLFKIPISLKFIECFHRLVCRMTCKGQFLKDFLELASPNTNFNGFNEHVSFNGYFNLGN